MSNNLIAVLSLTYVVGGALTTMVCSIEGNLPVDEAIAAGVLWIPILVFLFCRGVNRLLRRVY